MDNDNVTTKELERLVRESEARKWKAMRSVEGRMHVAVYDDSQQDWRYIAEFYIDGLVRGIDETNARLAALAPALAAEVLALRKRETQAREALEALLRKVEVLRAAYGGEWQDVEGMVEDALAAMPAERSE